MGHTMSSSICLTLSLAALTNNNAAANDAQCESCGTFESATYIGSLPLHLRPLSSSDHTAASSALSQYNASTYDDDASTPAELAEMISSASSSLPTLQPSTSNESRYYATYSETELCTQGPPPNLKTGRYPTIPSGTAANQLLDMITR